MNEKAESEVEATNKNRNPIWLAGIAISVLLGILIAWLGGSGSDPGSYPFESLPVFSLVIVWAYLINWLVFIPSYSYRTEKYFDLTGAATYITAILIALSFSEDVDLRGWIAAVLVIVWAARLGIFLFLRIRKDGHDVRFDEMKHDFWQFLMTWTIQGLWVSLTASTAFVIITAEQGVGLGWVGIVGLVVWLIGFSTEAIADYQKSQFKKDPGNKDKFISTGLWALSRHPNYFGEILLWTGMLILAFPVLNGYRWFAIISPVFVYLLLTRISGIPMLQRRANERWGADIEYQNYLKKTPLLIPWPFGQKQIP